MCFEKAVSATVLELESQEFICIMGADPVLHFGGEPPNTGKIRSH